MSKRDSAWTGRKIGFIGKGGAGKSTTLALFALALRRRGHDVCVLDTDSTNEGLHAALGIASPPRPLIDHFGGMVFQGGKVTCPADDPTLLEQADVELNDLPEKCVAENGAGVVFMTAGKLIDFGVGAGCDGPLVKIARDLVIHCDGKPMTILVDLKAGIEDTSRGVMVGMDEIVVVCDPTMAGLGVARCISQLINDLEHGMGPATLHIESPELAALARELFKQSRLSRMAVLLNRVPDSSTEQYMRGVLNNWGIEAIGCLPDVPSIREAWLRGTALPMDEPIKAPVTQVIDAWIGETTARGVAAS
jgi:CO dehydrogenase nickel-insertion accessory protein CooC1